MRTRFSLSQGVPCVLSLLVSACTGQNPDLMPDEGTPPADMVVAADLPAAPDMGTNMGMNQVTFRYTPQWQGVTAVAVLGGFMQAGDWTQPLVQLAKDGNGNWTGTAQLPDGQYPYVLSVTGDADAATPAKLQRYAIDPQNTGFVTCPMDSPTYKENPQNPCSQLTVPQPAPAPLQHVKGSVVYGGKPSAGYLVVLERVEKNTHHFFVNRVDSAADGTYDFPVSAGQYRVQVQYPTLEKETDAQRDPLKLLAVRRAISTGFDTSADVSLGPVEVAYQDYDKLSPTGPGIALPVTFKLDVITGAVAARVAVYGLASATAKNIGDPWYLSAAATSMVTFDGTFTTAQATEKKVVSGEQYYWGTEQDTKKSNTGLVWTLQSMVLPISFK